MPNYQFLEDNLHNIYDLKSTYDELKKQLESWLKKRGQELFTDNIIANKPSDTKDGMEIYFGKVLKNNNNFDSIGIGIFYDIRYEYNNRTAFYAYAYVKNNEPNGTKKTEEYFRKNISKEIIKNEQYDDCIWSDKEYTCICMEDSFQRDNLKNVPKNLDELALTLKILFGEVTRLATDYQKSLTDKPISKQ